MKTLELDTKSPNEILQIFGELYERFYERNDSIALIRTIEIEKSIDLGNFDQISKASYYLQLGIAWDYIQRIKYPKPNFEFDLNEIQEQILNYRKALLILKEHRHDLIMCRVLTNLGNTLSQIGRFVEAQELYNLCLTINPKYGRAIGNRGFSLFKYSSITTIPNNHLIFSQYARKDLLTSCKFENVHPNEKKEFLSKVKEIEKAYTTESLKIITDCINTKALEPKELEYRIWSAENKLFLNSLNDILTTSIAYNDYLPTDRIFNKNIEKNNYQIMLNQIKQEYATSRYFYYESIKSNKPHFSDNGVIIKDGLDNSLYSINLEKNKISFRVSYSIFDKISYFLNQYYKLENVNHRINFRNIWYKNLDKKRGLNNLISNSKNWPLKGLFWLSKDLYEKEFSHTIDPEAKELADIRNFIEHKSFKITENKHFIQNSKNYEIDRKTFEAKTLKILKLSRSAIIYLSYLTDLEESNRINEI